MYYIENIYFCKASEFYTGFLGTFAKLPKRILISSWLPVLLSLSSSVCGSVRLSVRMEQLRSHWKDFNEIWYWSIFWKCVKKIQDSLKSDRITGTVNEDQCKFVIISRSLIIWIKMFQTNSGLSKKMDGIWNRYNLKSTGRIYTFGVLKCSEKFKVLDLP